MTPTSSVRIDVVWRKDRDGIGQWRILRNGRRANIDTNDYYVKSEYVASARGLARAEAAGGDGAPPRRVELRVFGINGALLSTTRYGPWPTHSREDFGGIDP